MNDTWYIRGGRLVDPAANRDEQADLFIRNGIISVLPGAPPEGAPVVEAQGLVISPGLIDLHVHFREPGNTRAETIETGSLCAAKGGFTTVVMMPNTTPPLDTPEQISAARDRGKACGHVHALPAGCITQGRRGDQLADLRAMADAGAVAFTDDGDAVADTSLMEQAMLLAKDLGRPLLDHAVDPAQSRDGVVREGVAASALGIQGFPAEAEVSIVRRDIELCRKTECPVHIQHLSTAEAVALIQKAQDEGLPVTGEATPHHLALNDHDIEIDCADYKMNPPLGHAEDQEALIKGVRRGILQVLATDHAPHTSESKQQGFMKAPFGIIGLETAVGVTYSTLVLPGHLDLATWISRWTLGPAALLGITPPSLSPGSPADLVLLDLETPWTLRAENLLSKSQNSPFIGRSLTGQAQMTFLAGKVTWGQKALTQSHDCA